MTNDAWLMLKKKKNECPKKKSYWELGTKSP